MKSDQQDLVIQRDSKHSGMISKAAHETEQKHLDDVLSIIGKGASTQIIRKKQ